LEEAQTTTKDNIMGILPIKKLLFSLSVPMMLSMFVQALYNIVDSLFVSRINEASLTAVSLAFPLQMLMVSFGTGIGVGVNALLSRSLGEKKYDIAKQAGLHGIFLSALSAVCFTLIAIFIVPYYAASQSQNPLVVKYLLNYLGITQGFCYGLFGQFIFERLLASTGRNFYTMISQMSGAIINCILDPIMIFGLFGFPRMEIAGAALATVIGQTVAAILGIIFNIKKNPDITLNFKGFKPNGHIIRTILTVGIPSMFMQAIGSVMLYGYNLILLRFTETAVAVFGIYFKLQSFFFLPVFGLNNGMISIVAFNYGAKKRDRIVNTIKLAIAVALCFMAIGFSAFQLIPDKLLLIFDASPNMLEIGATALRRISFVYLFAGFCIIFISVLQALGNAMSSLYISLTRQLIVLLPAAYILAKVTNDVNAVWWSFPIAEFIALLISTVAIRRVYIKKLKDL